MPISEAVSERKRVRRVLRVTAAVICRGKRMLIARRSGAGPLSGYWEFPGGKIHPGETPEDCLVREIGEELGMTVGVVRALGSHEHRYAERTVRLLFFEAKPVCGRPCLSDHDRVAWVYPDGLKDFAFAPADRPMAEHIVRCRGVAPLPGAPTPRQRNHPCRRARGLRPANP